MVHELTPEIMMGSTISMNSSHTGSSSNSNSNVTDFGLSLVSNDREATTYMEEIGAIVEL